MITREQGLTRWADRWRHLRAWRRDLSDVKIEISKRFYANRLGTCWAHQQRVVIYQGDSFIDELSTLLHELAHAATIGAAHDDRWQEIFSDAVTEVTGIAVVPNAYNYQILNGAAKDTMATWWLVSGNAKLWQLAKGAPL